MIKIADLIGTLNNYHQAQRELEQCRLRATGDVEYFSYSFIQASKRAEQELQRALNGYIDQRIAEQAVAQHPGAPLPRLDPVPASN